MAGKRKKRETRQLRRAEILPRILAMLGGVAAVLFAVVVGFRVTNFTVTGNSAYTDEQVQEAAGVELGENLVLLYKSNIASSILANLPYVESVRVVRDLPGTVRVELTEGTAAAAIESEYGDWWLISASGKLMEQIDDETAATWPQIVGVTAQLPEAGDMLRLETDDARLTQLLTAVEEVGISGITLIDFSDSAALNLWIGDQYEVQLGSGEALLYQMQFLASVMDGLGDEAAGIIDLSFAQDQAAHYHPWSN